jgi:hypothetical protein
MPPVLWMKIPKPITGNWLNSQTFINLQMKTQLYLTVRIEVETELKLLECVRELENGTTVKISDTPNVRVLEQEVFLSVLPNPKN